MWTDLNGNRLQTSNNLWHCLYSRWSVCMRKINILRNNRNILKIWEIEENKIGQLKKRREFRYKVDRNIVKPTYLYIKCIPHSMKLACVMNVHCSNGRSMCFPIVGIEIFKYSGAKINVIFQHEYCWLGSLRKFITFFVKSTFSRWEQKKWKFQWCKQCEPISMCKT